MEALPSSPKSRGRCHQGTTLGYRPRHPRLSLTPPSSPGSGGFHQRPQPHQPRDRGGAPQEPFHVSSPLGMIAATVTLVKHGYLRGV